MNYHAFYTQGITIVHRFSQFPLVQSLDKYFSKVLKKPISSVYMILGLEGCLENLVSQNINVDMNNLKVKEKLKDLFSAILSKTCIN